MGALSTPTDATATESVLEGLIVPERQENILKMESLFNDASGIILVTAMALWVKNGQFNYQQTFLTFAFSWWRDNYWHYGSPCNDQFSSIFRAN